MTQKKQIMIVDDELSVLDAFRRSFSAFREEWDFTYVSQGAEALEKLRSGNYAVVVSDVYMPGVNGLELLRRIHEDEATRDIPVIMITGKFDSKVRKMAMEGGAADLIAKPVNTDQLIERILTQLDTKNRIDQLKVTNTDLLDKLHDQEVEISRNQIQILSCLGNIAESCDRSPGNHIARVGCYSVAIAQKYGLRQTLISHLSLAAPLHDVGKIGIPDKILQKYGPFQEDEETVFRRHCILGKQILQRPSTALTPWLSLEGESISLEKGDQDILNMAAMIALSHHEHWDGSGYPIGLKEEEIPLPARIVAYANHYDSLTAGLPGETKHTHEEAVQIIKDSAGKQFDPGLLNAFLAAQDAIRNAKERMQDQGERVSESPEMAY